MSQTTGGDHTIVLHASKHIGQRVASHWIDGSGIGRLLEWLAWFAELSAIDHGGSAKAAQIVTLGFGPTRGCNDLVTKLGQYGNCHAANTSGCAGHDHRAIGWLEALLLESDHTQHRGVASCADCCSLRRRHAVGDTGQPLRLHPGLLCQATPMGLTHVETVDGHQRARSPVGVVALCDGPDDIHARNHGITTNDSRATHNGHAVLVVHRRVRYIDQYVVVR